MPLLIHAMAGTLRCDSEAVELSGETDGEIGDVDHLLHFTLALGLDLAHLQGDERAERLLILAQQITDDANELSPLGGRQHTPLLESARRGGYDLLVVVGVGSPHSTDAFAGCGILDLEFGSTGLKPPTGIGTGADVVEIKCREDGIAVHESSPG